MLRAGPSVFLSRSPGPPAQSAKEEVLSVGRLLELAARVPLGQFSCGRWRWVEQICDEQKIRRAVSRNLERIATGRISRLAVVPDVSGGRRLSCPSPQKSDRTRRENQFSPAPQPGGDPLAGRLLHRNESRSQEPRLPPSRRKRVRRRLNESFLDLIHGLSRPLFRPFRIQSS